MQQQSLSQSHVRELILYVKYMKESNSISNRFCQCCFLWPSSEVAAITLLLERPMFILFRNLNLFAQTPWPEHQAAEPMWCVGWLQDNSFSRLCTGISCDMLMTGTLVENAVLLRNFLGSKVLFLLLLFTFFFFLSLWRVCVSIFMKCFEAVDFVLGQKVLKAYTSSPLSSCFPVCILSSCKLFFKKMPAKFVLAWRCCWQLHTDHRRSISGVFCGEKDILPMPPSHCRACNSFGSGLSNFSKDRIRNN